jgi:hypothetical protein
MIIENILSAVPANTQAWFYRTSVGAEIDLVLETAPNERWAIEMKRSLSDPKPSKGLYIACDDVKANHQIVVYPGQESYKHDAKTEIMPLDTLLKKLSRQETRRISRRIMQSPSRTSSPISTSRRGSNRPHRHHHERANGRIWWSGAS